MLIGMNVELGDTLKNTLGSQSAEITLQLNSLAATVGTLLGSWQGASRLTFENEWTPWVQQVNGLVGQMQDLEQRLGRTIESFRSADMF